MPHGVVKATLTMKKDASTRATIVDLPHGNAGSARLRVILGAGGSLGFADPKAGMSFGYTMNKMGPGLSLNERGQSLVDAVYRALGYQSDASGAWR